MDQLKMYTIEGKRPDHSQGLEVVTPKPFIFNRGARPSEMREGKVTGADEGTKVTTRGGEVHKNESLSGIENPKKVSW